MIREQEASSPTQRYQIPTHLNVPDKIGVNVFGLGIELTIRQGLICLVGGAIALRCWHLLEGLNGYGTWGTTLRLLVLGLIIVLTLLIALVRIADRPIETWLGILLDYWLRPKVYLWKSIVHDPTYRLHEEDEGLEAMELHEEEEVSL